MKFNNVILSKSNDYLDILPIKNTLQSQMQDTFSTVKYCALAEYRDLEGFVLLNP